MPSSPALEKFMQRIERSAPVKPSPSPLPFFLAGGLALVGGLTLALAFRRKPESESATGTARTLPAGNPSTPFRPTSTPPIERALSTEAAWQQFWYDRGYRGDPLGTIPEPTDTFWSLGAAEKKLGRPRRDLLANPPTEADWRGAGVVPYREIRPEPSETPEPSTTYPRRVVERGITWLVFPAPNPDNRPQGMCAMWPCNGFKGSEDAYPESDVAVSNGTNGTSRYVDRRSKEVIWVSPPNRSAL